MRHAKSFLEFVWNIAIKIDFFFAKSLILELKGETGGTERKTLM